MHRCPDCGKRCTCGGDYDDIDWGDSFNCECCSDLLEENCSKCNKQYWQCECSDAEFEGLI